MYSTPKTSMSDFKIERQLGKGSFSCVYLVTRKADQKIYALKSVTMDKLTKKEQQNSVNEVRILASVSHPNVIGYREAFWDDNAQTLNIVMEYADDGDLQTKIHQMKKNSGVFEEETIWSYAIQMIEGLKALHDKKIMHRDLKSANIFLSKNKNNNKKICKIGDMNVSKVVKEKVLMTQTGTPYYASPEVWNDKPYSYKSDLWSIGCVIYELCALRPPFKGKDLDELYVNVCKGKVDRIKKIYSDKLWNMILMLLQVDVNKRYNCDQFLNHPIITQKIKEMRMKDSEYNDLEENKNIKDGCLLNTINFKDLKEIKAQLPTKKNYGNNLENKRDYNYNYNYLYNNNFIKKDYFTSFDSKKLEENNKEYNINNNVSNELLRMINNSNINKNGNNFNINNNYNKYIDERINKILNNNSTTNRNNTYNNIINTNNILNNNNYMNNNEHLNIINNKSTTNHYTDYLNKLREYDIHRTEENKNINNKLDEKDENMNNNYNLYDHILQTDIGVNNLLKKDNLKNNLNDIRFTYENMNTEERIDYNEKITKLKKEKNKIIEKQKEKKMKTIEDEINEYKNLLNKKIEPVEQKFNNYLNIVNYYNSNHSNKKIEYDLSNLSSNKNAINNNINSKKEKLKDKYNLYNEKIINKHVMTLSPNPHSKNINQTTSTRKNNLDSNEIMYKKINSNTNNKNRMSDNYENNKKTTRHTLNKKNPSYNNFIERAKTPTSKYINKSSTKALMNKNQENNENKKSQYYNSLINNHNDINITQNSVLNKATSKDYLTTQEKKNIINNIKNSINSMKINNNSIKRINKPYININKKRNNGISENHHNTKIRQKSSMGIKKYTNKSSHIYFKNNTNNNDLTNFNSNKNNSKNILSKYQQNKINFDLNKELNDINLTCIDENRNIKNSLYKIQKITTENDNEDDKNNSNIIIPNNKNNNNKLYNKKYSVTFNDNNNNIKNNKKIQTNKIKDYNCIIPNQTMNNNNNQSSIHNNQIIQYAKKLNARSNSYRITSHGNANGYINKKRKLNYKYYLTQPEEKIKNNLQLNTSKAKNAQIINYSLINNGVNFMNLNTNDSMNKNNIINNNKFDDRYIMNMQNSSTTPQIFNNYYSINGVVTSTSPIKVINVFNN